MRFIHTLDMVKQQSRQLFIYFICFKPLFFCVTLYSVKLYQGHPKENILFRYIHRHDFICTSMKFVGIIVGGDLESNSVDSFSINVLYLELYLRLKHF